jgi:magnesium chelatase family protein
LSSVRGNETAKRGLEIAAAGAHNLILYGPPGTGKSLLARCLPSILPNLSYEESVEVTGMHSISQNLDHGFITRPPFRSPHHTASYPSIVGGGAFPKPGEITLAHRGILFMDEFPEFDRDVIEALRQPLEDRSITISRAKGVVTFPAQCILIASMNPCPCGMGKEKGCTCTAKTLRNYESKVSGPIADRIDIWLNIDKVDYKKLGDPFQNTVESGSIKKRVVQSRIIQEDRFKKYKINKKFNSEMSGEDTEKLIHLDPDARKILIASAEKLGMSGRAFHRTLKVAQTIADLSQGGVVTVDNILEAIQYRDRRRL